MRPPSPSRRSSRALLAFAMPAAIVATLAVRAALAPSSIAPPPAPPSAEPTAPLPWPLPGDGDTAAPPNSASPTSAPPSSTSPAASQTASLDSPSRARVLETSPSGAGVPLDAKITLRFDRPPDPATLRLTLDPPVEGQLAFLDPTTATFTPARWADGKPYKVRASGPDVETATFEFRSLFPAPERVEPGLGQRLTFTFDDGADRPAQVTALLDYLEKEQIQAIFFPIGRWAEAHPHLIERMIHDGHRVCNHTYSHQNLRLPQLTEAEIRAEITRGATDGTCRLFRPPLKAFDPRVEQIIASLGLTLYLWDVDSRDWEGATSDDIVNLVLARAHPGAVVLFHMHAQASLDALPRVVPRLRKAGYVLRDP